MKIEADKIVSQVLRATVAQCTNSSAQRSAARGSQLGKRSYQLHSINNRGNETEPIRPATKVGFFTLSYLTQDVYHVTLDVHILTLVLVRLSRQ